METKKNVIRELILELMTKQLYEGQRGTKDLCLNIRIRISECKQIIYWIENNIGGYK